jgi:hypothetical protein
MPFLLHPRHLRGARALAVRAFHGRAALALASSALSLTSCGGDRVAGPSRPRLAELWVEVSERASDRAPADTIERGERRSLHARGRFTDGRVAEIDSAAWTVSDAAVLRLAAAGPTAATTLAGDAEGAAVVVAAAGGLRAEVRYSVLRPVVRHVNLVAAGAGPLPQPDSVMLRATRRYSAEVLARGGPLSDRAATWASSDPAVATVADDGTITPLALGTTTVSATVDGVRAEAAVVVRPPLAARLVFTYAPDSLLARRTDSVRAVLLDSAGQPIPVVPRLRPSSDQVQVGTGTVRGTTVGRYELIASGDGLEARRSIRILQVPQGPPAAYPAAVVATAGSSVLLAARAVDADGFGFGAADAPVFASADPGVAGVTAAGVVRTGAPGTTSIRVRTGATEVDVPVTVVAAGGFDIDVQSATTSLLPATLGSAIVEAAARWQRAVLGDLPDVRFTLPAGACDRPGAPAEELVIDDLVVYASADSIDGPGGVLAQAGPCVVRTNGATAVGRVYMDAADLTTMANTERLVTVLQHELGHVLGIGTLWGRGSNNLLVRVGPDWRYRGARGVRVSDWWERTATDATGGVPLGEASGFGNGHWSESAFGNELMTPVINRGANPLSLITLEALADLGYLTSAAAAEPYALYAGASGAVSPSRAPAPGAPRDPETPVDRVPFDRVIEPVWRVDGPGRVTRLPVVAPVR